MENVVLVFHENESATELKLFANSQNKLYISINQFPNSSEGSFITLNRDTAIKLSKELRKQISYLEV